MTKSSDHTRTTENLTGGVSGDREWESSSPRAVKESEEIPQGLPTHDDVWARDTLSRLLDQEHEEAERRGAAPATATTEVELDDPDVDQKETLRYHPADLNRAVLAHMASTSDGSKSLKSDSGLTAPESNGASADPERETLIGDRYQLLEGLAVGGMGAVYKVKHQRLLKTFALKVMHPARAQLLHLVKGFLQEALVLSQLDHPNIVGVIDFGVDDSLGAFLVMEYLKGETLQQRLDQDRKLHLRLALQVGLQIAEALQYLHGLELVHRDIKPENIFLCRVPQGGRNRIQIKLIDFGLTRAHITHATISETERGGTPEYASPEQFAGVAPAPTMDIYAVGVLLYEIITGMPAFTGNPSELILQKTMGAVRPPSSLMSEGLDEPVERLILTALSVNPDHRQQSMSELIYELRTIMEMHGFGERSRRRASRPKPSVEVPVAPESARSALRLDDSPVPTCVVGQGQTILGMNSGFRELFGFSADAQPDRPISESAMARLHPGVGDDVRKVLSSGSSLHRELALPADERRGVVHLSMTPYSAPPDDAPAVWCTALVVDAD